MMDQIESACGKGLTIVHVNIQYYMYYVYMRIHVYGEVDDLQLD